MELEFYRKMFTIRRLEEAALELFSKGLLNGTVHTCIGQESCAVGVIAALGNRLLLRQAMPTERQILLWDRVMIPCSRLIDPLIRYRIGKSILAVWERV